MPPVSQCSLPAAAVGAEGAGEEGDSLVWLGPSRPPTDGLSLVPRNICFCSHFIHLLLLQLAHCRAPLPHTPTSSENSQGECQGSSPTAHHPPAQHELWGGMARRGGGGGLVDCPFLNAIPWDFPWPSALCLSFPPQHRGTQAKRQDGEGRKGIRGNQHSALSIKLTEVDGTRAKVRTWQ